MWVRLVATGLCHTDLSAREGGSRSRCRVCSATRAPAWSRRSARASPTSCPATTSSSRSRSAALPDVPHRPPRVLRELAGPEPVRRCRPDGSPTLHRNGARLHGHFFGQSSLATRALATARSVIKVPHDAPLELLGPLACGIQTGAQSVLNVLRPEPGHAGGLRRRWRRAQRPARRRAPDGRRPRSSTSTRPARARHPARRDGGRQRPRA